MRRLLLAMGVVLLGGCTGSVNGDVAGIRLHVRDAIFWFARDETGRVNGAYVTLADEPNLCDAYRSNRQPSQLTSLSFTLFRLTPTDVLPPVPGQYAVTTEPTSVGDFSYALFSRTDLSCFETLSDSAGFGQSGFVRLQRLRAEPGGNATGTFDVTFGTGDRSTGSFNAEYCDLSAAPLRPTCE